MTKQLVDYHRHFTAFIISTWNKFIYYLDPNRKVCT